MFCFLSKVSRIPSSRQAHKQQAVTDGEVLHSYPSAHSSQKKIIFRMRQGCTSLVHNLHPIQRYCFSSASISPLSSSPLSLVDVEHTLTNPISCAFSLNACRLMLSPYLRMMPDVFLSPVTTLLAISMWFEVIARQYEEIGEERREEGSQTSRASLCRRFEDGSTRLIRGTCGRLLVGVAGLEGFKV
jgi:hypothetical protein